MLEVSWSCVPLKNRETDLPLFERVPLFGSSHQQSCTKVFVSKQENLISPIDIPICSIVSQPMLQSCVTQSSHKYFNQNENTLILVQKEMFTSSDKVCFKV